MSERASLRAEQVEQTRAALLAAGRLLFGRDGYAVTSVDDLAREARVTTGALYHHFPGKAALFEAVFELVHMEMLQASAEASGSAGPEAGVEWFAAGFDAFLGAMLEPDVRQIVITDAPAVLGLARFTELDERWAFPAIAEGLRVATEAGTLRVADPDTLARLLFGACTRGAMLIASSADPRATRDAVAASLRAMLSGFAALPINKILKEGSGVATRREPAAREADRGDPAGGTEAVDGACDHGQGRPSWRGEPQAGQTSGIDDVHVYVQVQRPVGQPDTGQVSDRAGRDVRLCQVRLLRRIQVTGAGQYDPLLRHRRKAQGGSDQLRPVAGQQPQRHSGQVPRRRGLRRLHVPVRVQPDDAGAQSGPLQAGHRAERGGAVTGQHRDLALTGPGGHRLGQILIEDGETVPGITGWQLGGYYRSPAAWMPRQDQIGQVLV
jgi:AcrR family transcriptional regulator